MAEKYEGTVARMPEEEQADSDQPVAQSQPKASIGTKIGNLASGAIGAIGAGFSSLFGGAGRAVATAGAAFSTTSAKFASAMSISHRVASVFLAVALLGGVSSGIYIVGSATSFDDMARRAGKVVDCDVAEAKEKYGYGERTIPETIGDLTIGDGLGVFGSPMATMMGRNGPTNWNLGTDDRSVVQHGAVWSNGGPTEHNWKTDGYLDDPSLYVRDEQGFYRWGEYYLLGVSPAGFGRTPEEGANVGDWITFYWEDGSSFDCIIFDTKGAASGKDINGVEFDFLNGTPPEAQISLPDPQGLGRRNVICAYGHVYENNTVNILEFLTGYPYVGIGTPGVDCPDKSPYEALGHKGERLESFTNHGTAPEVLEVASRMGLSNSILGTAYENQGAARKNGMNEAAQECRSDCKKTYDNSGIAEAALSMSYSNLANGMGLAGTELYLEVMKRCEVSEPSMSCDRGVCTSVRWAGADDEYPVGITDDQLEHVLASDKWEEVTDYVPGSKDFSMLQPGDIFLNHGGINGHIHGHTSVYVSEELLSEYEFSGDADVGPTPEGSFSCSASLGTNALCAGDDDAAHVEARVFRCVKPEENSKYADGSIEGGTVAAASGCEKTRKNNEQRNVDTEGAEKLDGWVYPLKKGTYVVSSEWGGRVNPVTGASEGHSGIDLAANAGTEIVAAGPGQVSHVGYDPDGGMGNNVWIQHSNGKMTIYMHMQKHRAGIKVGDRVKAGDLIGYVGTTGQSTGNHLHFTICEDYNYSSNVNPRKYYDFD